MSLPEKTTSTQALTTEELSAFDAYTSEASNIQSRKKFKKGVWSDSETGETVPADEAFVVNVRGAWREWIKWVDKEPVDRVVVPISSGKPFPEREELGDLDQELWDTDGNGDPQDPWQEQHGFTMRSLATSEEHVCAFGSKGGINAVAKLVGQFKFKSYAEGQPMFPEVLLRHVTKPNKRHKVDVDYPVFAVQRWHSMTDLLGGARAELDDDIPY